MAKLSGLLWWNFAYTLVLIRCSPRDCHMSFRIGRGIAEVQILKNSETGPISWNFLNILIKFCIHINIDVSLTEGLPNVIYHQKRLCRGPNLKTSETDPLSWTVWNILISKLWKKVKLKWTLHIFMRKKVQIQDIIVLCVWDGMGMERGGEGRGGTDGRTRKKKDT